MEHLTGFLKGLLMGIANAIPGVSGGTIAVITGIYDKFLESVSGFFTSGTGGWKKNALFLLPIGMGVGSGLFGFSKILVWGYEQVPVQTTFLFVGLILGSFPYLVQVANKEKYRHTFLIPGVLAFLLLVFLAYSSRTPETQAYRTLDLFQGIQFFLGAVLGMGAMVVPGISGSFVLLLLGQYSTFITAVAEFNLPILTIFSSGALLGLVLISRLLSWLLVSFHGLAYYGILGLVAGSVFDMIKRALNPEYLLTSQAVLGFFNWPLTALVLGLGIWAALSLSGNKKDSRVK